jgi:hypothetical protein
MLHERLRHAWHARERAIAISPVLTLAPEGLVLGAGTILARADSARRLQSLDGQEARVLALLSAAYGKAIAPSMLGNIERAAKAWREGDDCLAYIHLAHTGLRELQDRYEVARRLFIVDGFMKAGTRPRAVFDALGFGAAYADTIEKLYNPEEPRVPAGSGGISGQWTRLLSWIGELDATQIVELGAYASRVLGSAGAAAAAFGLLFVPSRNNIRVDGEVTGIPGLRYSWNRDETVLHLTYDGAGGAQRTFALNVDGDLIRDHDGQIVGHVVGGNRIAIETIAVLPDLVKQDQPRLCPAPALDVAGSDQGKQYEENRSRQYEDFVKLLINPPPAGPTSSGFVYYLPLPEGGEQSYDDCKKLNGFLFEIKGEGLAKLTNDLPGALAVKFIGQATRQLAASGGRPVIWIFAEWDAALFTRRLFDLTPGLGRITVGYVPWTRSNR